MDSKSDARNLNIGRSVAGQSEQVCKDCGVSGGTPNLKVESSEAVVLSYESERFRAVHRQIRPQSIDEVRKLMGVTQAVADTVGKTHQCGCSKGGRYFGLAELESDDQAMRGKALAAARASARQFVMGGAAASASQKAVLDRYIQLAGTVVNLAFLLDIEIQNGGTLVIAPSTHGLYARNIRIHGTGRIVCQGPTTINCTAITGDYRSRFGPVVFDPNINIAVKTL
jgi:hypothetical protein